MLKRLLAIVIVATAACEMVGCTTNAATGRSQFNLLSRSEEIALGEQSMEELIAGYGGRVSSPALQEYVASIGRQLASKTEADYPSLPWEFTFLDSKVINAFALPGGKVFMSRGLAEKMTTEAQLAGVLGHEVGHVTAEHADKHISRQLLLQGLATAGAVVAGTQESELMGVGLGVLVSGAGVYELSFGRDEELEADRLGVRYMVECGYDPRGQLEVMQILKEASGGGGQSEFLSTHPDPDRRIKQIKKLLKDEYAFTQGNANFVDYKSRFQADFLAPLSKLAPPADAASAWLADPRNWCAVCASEGHHD
ncbi:MAG: M48 family metalloprotease [Phycisphaerales bacterium]|nr:M48 family metalloprotease [Phycisphaerales bacterium]